MEADYLGIVYYSGLYDVTVSLFVFCIYLAVVRPTRRRLSGRITRRSGNVHAGAYGDSVNNTLHFELA